MPYVVIATLRTGLSPIILKGQLYKTYSDAEEAGLREKEACKQQGWEDMKFHVRKVHLVAAEVGFVL